MKKLLQVDTLPKHIDVAILIARIGIAALMLTHGLPKLSMLLSGEPVQFLPFMGLSQEVSLALAVFAEVFCSILLLVGFATRLAVVPLIITMLVALLMVHAADPFQMKEPALHYLLVYVVLLLTGSGRYSVDYLLQSKADRKAFSLSN
ncbi:putative oxidoreductase [Cnuella takakiae]|uniref:Putative oxidoreductase n=1 Tax=Cnuella takakiae TaxID=1302690 RepID=A0A1M5E084_9BACT|nr:DoxX family protein [Cnuella takakiae]OLY94967.1 DoxX family protein [Cnuella takakiae]SHF72492.1 putative oxidoreductase [Cnuella takakiae]